MNLKALEYANFAMKSLIKGRPVENFVFRDALNGISNFLKSGMKENEKELVKANIDVLNGITNILKINFEGGSCIKEIIEVNYSDFSKLVDQLHGLHQL